MVEHLGIWYQAASAPHSWVTSPAQFAAQLFQGIAKFTSLEVIINENFTQEIAWVDQLATAADSMQGVMIEVMCVLNPAVPTTSNEYFTISNWESMVDKLKGHPSIISFGLNGERSQTITSSDYVTLGAYIASAGKRFINYFTPKGINPPSNFEEIGHTNFPREAQFQVVPTSELSLYQTKPYVGESQGYFAPYMNPYWNQSVLDSIESLRGNAVGEFCNMAYADPLNLAFQNMVASSPFRNLFANGGSTPPPSPPPTPPPVPPPTPPPTAFSLKLSITTGQAIASGATFSVTV